MSYHGSQMTFLQIFEYTFIKTLITSGFSFLSEVEKEFKLEMLSIKYAI